MTDWNPWQESEDVGEVGGNSTCSGEYEIDGVVLCDTGDML